MAGPLAGTAVIELAGLGAAPFCGMVLADLGAQVVRVDRTGDASGSHTVASKHDALNRGKLSIAVDLKSAEGADVVLDLVARSDVLIEGFRPGVAERLGVGPAECLSRNRAVVYGRMTGWGQDGPKANEAGHDINYIALAGALAAIGSEHDPVPPLNLVGDFGGGGMLLAVGVLAGLLHSRESGVGQVVDAAMVDGTSLLMASTRGYMDGGDWTVARKSNLLDGGAPFYSVYRTSDGKHVAVGALETQFFANLLSGLNISPDDLRPQHDRTGWDKMRARFADEFAKRSRDEWDEHFSGLEACVAPVLDMTEAPRHPHSMARTAFVETEGLSQPSPAPRFSVTAPEEPMEPSFPGRDTDSVLLSLGYTDVQIGKLRSAGAIG
ncbi:MAG: CaiB/BaiF CoA transferase family protein [Acidimicrobiia bacterium]